MWRTVRDRRIEVAVIHRPRRDDWSLPKGKLRLEESILECALREVHEETGLRCVAHVELPETRYRNRKGKPKRVRYWAMTEQSGEFRPNDEVDELRWLHIDIVGGLLTYVHDLAVVGGLSDACGHSSTVGTRRP